MEHHSLLHKKKKKKKSFAESKCQSWIVLSSWGAHIQCYNPVPSLAETHHSTLQKKTHPKQHVETQWTSSKYTNFQIRYQAVLTLQGLKIKTSKDSDTWKISPVKLMCSVTQGTKSTPCQRFLLPEASLWILINSRLSSFIKTSTDLTDYTWEWPKLP